MGKATGISLERRRWAASRSGARVAWAEGEVEICHVSMLLVVVVDEDEDEMKWPGSEDPGGTLSIRVFMVVG